MIAKEIVKKIREGEIDINNQSLFLPIVIKGLLLKLNEKISIRDIKIPHFILHTGDDTMYLDVKGQNAAIEPLEISNEDYVYNTIPRCLVTARGIEILSDQLTSPYSLGQIQYDKGDSLYTLSGEFRRMPIKLSVNCKYYVDSWTDMMELMQQIISKLCFIQTYNISYMGQKITCSYNIPTSLEGDYMTELDDMTQDNKARTLEISLDVETNFPVFENRTIMSSDDVIVYTGGWGEMDKYSREDKMEVVETEQDSPENNALTIKTHDEETGEEKYENVIYPTAPSKMILGKTQNSK